MLALREALRDLEADRLALLLPLLLRVAERVRVGELLREPEAEMLLL